MENRNTQILDNVLKRLLLFFFFCLLVVYASREVADLDLWLHLKTGEYILQHKTIPPGDIFAFTIYGKPWINHEWLFQVITYLFHAAWGPTGLILMQNIIVVLTFLFLWMAFRRRNNLMLIFSVLYLAVLASAYRFMIRPDIFSLLFLSAYLCVLKDFNENNSAWIWILPFAQIIWVNIHGFAFAGPLLVGVFLLSEFIKRMGLGNNVRRLDNRQVKQLFMLLAILLLVSFINPYGSKGAFYPFLVLEQISGKGKVIFQYVKELASPINPKNLFDGGRFLYYKVLLIVSFFSFIFNRKRINIADLLLWLFFLFSSLVAARNAAIFAIVAAFVTLNNAQLFWENRGPLFSGWRKSILSPILKYLCVAALFYYPARGAQQFLELVADSLGTYALKSSRNGVAEATYPQKAVDFLLKNNFPKYMFNDFNSGSFLVYNVFPRRQVFIDGRTELYGPDFFSDYALAGSGEKEVIEKIIKKYAIKAFFLTISAHDLQDGLIDYLLYNPDWKIVYLDEAAIIFVQDIPENRALIKKFQINLKDWEPPSLRPLKNSNIFPYPFAYLYRARFFHRHALYANAAKESRVILSLVPNNQEALDFIEEACFNRALIASNKGELDQAILDYSKVIEINPQNANAYNNRAVAFFWKQEYAKSWKDVQSAQMLGFKVHPGFIQQLKASSGKEE
ncbi:MAG: tetratricopeptide repeat protein [Candidatus Omnitrophica bacterium]|nr:tetratricopeptide repeat protein [Candidatus Omnitrophota bacterium]